MKCKQCNRQIRDQEIFCSYCGCKVEVIYESEIKTSKELSYCYFCGGENPSHAKFCSSCGKAINLEDDTIICHNCGSEMSKSSNFCNECGNERAATNDRGEVVTQNSQKTIDLEIVAQYFKGKNVWLITSVIISSICVVLLLQNWINIPLLGYFGNESSVSLFKLYGWLKDGLSIVNAGMPLGAALIILINIVCIAMFVISIYQAISGVRSSISSNTAATVLLGALFLIILIMTASINSYIKKEFWFSASVNLTAAPYCAIVLALINRIAVVGRIPKSALKKVSVNSEVEQIICPQCEKHHDFDYPKCPHCGHFYEY